MPYLNGMCSSDDPAAIVLRLGSRKQFAQHYTLAAAINEAARLAAKHGDEFTVYVPVRVVRPRAAPVEVLEYRID